MLHYFLVGRRNFLQSCCHARLPGRYQSSHLPLRNKEIIAIFKISNYSFKGNKVCEAACELSFKLCTCVPICMHANINVHAHVDECVSAHMTASLIVSAQASVCPCVLSAFACVHVRMCLYL